jgi:uncharacterized protein (TIGR02300 family)
LTARDVHGKRRPDQNPEIQRGGVSPVSKDKLGTKQVCPSCEARFYDLNKRPAVCPKCGEEFDPDDEVIRTTITKVKAKAARAAVKAEDDDEDDDCPTRRHR